MSTKGPKLVKNVKFIERCNKEHICTYCTTPIPKGSFYFSFSKYIQYQNGVRTYIKDSPYKCCFVCFPTQYPEFKKEEKNVQQMQLGILSGPG